MSTIIKHEKYNDFNFVKKYVFNRKKINTPKHLVNIATYRAY